MGSPMKVFISHSNDLDNQDPIFNEIIPKLKAKGIEVVEQTKLLAGNLFLPTLTQLIDGIEKTLMFVTPEYLKSPWCNLELLLGLEISQAKNQLAVVMLLYEVSEDKLPQIAVLQETPKIRFQKNSNVWVSEVISKLNEKRSIKHVMPAGNVAHGLVWSHFTGYQQFVIPLLEETIKGSDWYRDLQPELQSKVSFKLYEMVPKSCACQKNLPACDGNITEAETLEVKAMMKSGNFRKYDVKIYKVQDGNEVFFCACEYPSVIETMKAMKDHHLADFNDDDRKLQLQRFYYTMNTVLNHFDNIREKYRVLLFDDETERISEVLVKAVKEDLQLTQHVIPEEGWISPEIENLEPEDMPTFKYHVYVAHTGSEEDNQLANEIIGHLERHNICNILKSSDIELPGKTQFNVLEEASTHCRWIIFLLTKDTMENKIFQSKVLTVLNDAIHKRRARVIPVANRHLRLDFIPEALKWVTYVPVKEDKSHLENIHNIVSGEDLPLKTDLLLPAGDVANGLAWGYVTNYLMIILPDALEGIQQAMSAKNVENYHCPKKLFVIIPKSCKAGGLLKDKKDTQGGASKIVNFTQFPGVNIEGRSYNSQIYRIGQQDDYFVGQYASPITCLDEMASCRVAGINESTMAPEAERFYCIVKNLTEGAAPEIADFCEFVIFDDMQDSLADIMATKIQTLSSLQEQERMEI